MLVDRSELLDVLACPVCGAGLLATVAGLACSATTCAHSAGPFPQAGDHAVLVDFDRSLLVADEVLARFGASPVIRERPWLFRAARRRLVRPNPVARRKIEELRARVKAEWPSPRVLVVGGGVVGSGVEPLYTDPDVRLISCDVYASPVTQFIADGHQLPLRDGSVDAVVMQGVLPVVIDPQRVVDELHRVLRPAGLAYVESAFVQQVCEGPYDFARFSESGHRYLLRQFEVIESGAAAGPATQLLTSLDHLARAVFRSRTAGAIIKALFFWLRYLDDVLPADYSVDAAATVYFLGRRAEQTISAQDAIAHYKGAQRTASTDVAPSGMQSAVVNRPRTV